MTTSARSRRRLLQLAAASLLPQAPRAFAQAGDFPRKAVTMIVPYTAGGGVDTLARLMLPSLTSQLGQPVIIDNRPGVSGIVGAQIASHAAPDGYTLLAGNLTTTVMNGLLLKNPGYRPEHDFAPLALVNSFPMVLVVNPQSRFKSVQEVITAAKAEPDGLTFGSSGIGSAQHLAAALFQDATKTRMRHVPYKGGNGTHDGFDRRPARHGLRSGAGGRPLRAQRPPARPGPHQQPRNRRPAAVKPIAQSACQVTRWCSGTPSSRRLGTPAPVVERLSKVILATVASSESSRTR